MRINANDENHKFNLLAISRLASQSMILKLTVDRFENDKAILKTEDNNAIIWPKNKLPKNAHEGAVFTFIIADDKQKEGDDKQLAKDILNEILKT